MNEKNDLGLHYYFDSNNKIEEIDSPLLKVDGYFDREFIEFGFSAIDFTEIRNKFDKMQNIITQKFKEKGLSTSRLHKTKEMIECFPELIDIILLGEIWNHEIFHYYQFLSLTSLNNVLFAHRFIQKIKCQYLIHHIKNNGKFYNDKGFKICKTFNDYIYISKSISSNISELLDHYCATIDNFKKKYDGLSANHIVEGAAYYFQKITNQSLKVKTFDVEEDYKLAYNEYTNAGGKAEAIFLLLCNAALRNGNINSENFHNTPVGIYKALLQHVNKLEELLKDDGEYVYYNNNIYIENLIISKFNDFQYKLFIKLDSISRTIQKIVEKFFDSNAHNNRKCSDIDECLETKINDTYNNLYNIFEKNNPKLLILLESKKLRIMHNHFYNKFENFKSDRFLLLLLIQPSFLHEYFYKAICEIDSLYLHSSTIKEDNLFYFFIDIVIKLINRDVDKNKNKNEKPPTFHCCREHGDDEEHILKCSNNPSLNFNFKRLFNKELHEILEFRD